VTAAARLGNDLVELGPGQSSSNWKEMDRSKLVDWPALDPGDALK